MLPALLLGVRLAHAGCGGLEGEAATRCEQGEREMRLTEAVRAGQVPAAAELVGFLARVRITDSELDRMRTDPAAACALVPRGGRWKLRTADGDQLATMWCGKWGLIRSSG